MGVLSLRTGDLFTSEAHALAHGVNTQGRMGSGIAKQFRLTYPEMFSEYQRICHDGLLAPGGLFPWRIPGEERWVYNLASQELSGPNARVEWVAASAAAMIEHAEKHAVPSVALPRIGAGIGALSWSAVEPVLSDLAQTTSVQIEVWTLPEDPASHLPR